MELCFFIIHSNKRLTVKIKMYNIIYTTIKLPFEYNGELLLIRMYVKLPVLMKKTGLSSKSCGSGVVIYGIK